METKSRMKVAHREATWKKPVPQAGRNAAAVDRGDRLAEPLGRLSGARLRRVKVTRAPPLLRGNAGALDQLAVALEVGAQQLGHRRPGGGERLHAQAASEALLQVGLRER